MTSEGVESVPARWRKPLILALKLTLGGALIWWLIWSGRFDPSVYNALFAERTARFLLGVLVGQGIMLLVPLVRWWLLLRAQGLPISLGEAIRISLMGAFANLFVPGGLGIDGLRLLYLRRFHRGQWVAGASSVVMDRALGVVALLALGGTCSLILLVQNYNPWVFRLVAINAILLVGLLAGLALACGFLRVPILPVFRRVSLVDKVVRAMQVYRTHRGALAWGLLLSIIGHLGVCVAACFALLSLSYPVTVVAVVTVTPIVTMSRTIPLTPLGLGVSDSVAALLYPLVGLDGGAEVQMLLRATIVLVFLACGLAYFKGRQEVLGIEEQQLGESKELLVKGGA